MAEKTYLVKTPLRRNTRGKDANDVAQAGEVIALDEKIAGPLVDCGALEEQQSAAKPKK